MMKTNNYTIFIVATVWNLRNVKSSLISVTIVENTLQPSKHTYKLRFVYNGQQYSNHT